MELYQLRSLIAVAEEGNLTRAAERLFTSQPAVSAHIKALEDELGLRLFDRSARGMSLTANGESILEKAYAMASAAREMTGLARQLQSSPSGPLRVGIVIDGDDVQIESISQRLNESSPGITLEFFHSSSGAISKALRNGDLDVGFHEGDVDSPLFYRIQIGTTQVHVIGSPQHASLLASRDWKDLAKLPWVFKTPDCSYHQLMLRISQAHGLELNKRYVIDHEATCLQFVRNGNPISIVNVNTTKDDIQAGRLMVWPYFRGELELSLLCLAKRRQEQAIQSFFDATRQVLKL